MSAAADTEAAWRTVRATVAGARSSFFWGMRVLPAQRRDAIFAVYAYCRAIDDIADGADAAVDKRAALAAWRETVRTIERGERPAGAIALALADAQRRFALPTAELHQLLDGMARDAEGGAVASTYPELWSYCRQVAGAVGMLAMPIFAAGDPRADAATQHAIAVTLGEALQLTNILRDLGDDAARGRRYLPNDLLAESGVAARTPDGLLHDPNLPVAGRTLAAAARRRFARSRELLAGVAPRTARPCRLMLEVYARLLARIEAADWRRPGERVRVPTADKMTVVLRHAVR